MRNGPSRLRDQTSFPFGLDDGGSARICSGRRFVTPDLRGNVDSSVVRTACLVKIKIRGWVGGLASITLQPGSTTTDRSNLLAASLLANCVGILLSGALVPHQQESTTACSQGRTEPQWRDPNHARKPLIPGALDKGVADHPLVFSWSTRKTRWWAKCKAGNCLVLLARTEQCVLTFRDDARSASVRNRIVLSFTGNWTFGAKSTLAILAFAETETAVECRKSSWLQKYDFDALLFFDI